MPEPNRALRFGAYELLERLGAGGMAEVWKARRAGPSEFQRLLAVKRILPELVEDEHFVRLFVREARISAELRHTNVVQVFELGDVDGRWYLAMEYVEGQNLRAVVASAAAHGPLDPGLGVYVTREVCRALAYVHGLRDDAGKPRGLVHRDVSLSNVMLAQDGAVKLLDFGIAKARGESTHVTRAGTLRGKLSYMAPELIDGAAADARSDLFAVGVMLHEALTGISPFAGKDDDEIIEHVRTAELEAPSRHNPLVPAELDAICLRALARDRSERFADAEAMMLALDPLAHSLRWGPTQAAALLMELSDTLEPTRRRVAGTTTPETRTLRPAAATSAAAAATGRAWPRPSAAQLVVLFAAALLLILAASYRVGRRHRGTISPQQTSVPAAETRAGPPVTATPDLAAAANVAPVDNGRDHEALPEPPPRRPSSSRSRPAPGRASTGSRKHDLSGGDVVDPYE